MNRTARISSRLGLALAAALALGAAAAVPASGHTGSLFTVLTGPEVSGSQMATINATTAAITGFSAPVDLFINGIEIVNETAYAITETEIDDDTSEYSIAVWDHTTGALLSSVPIVLSVPGLVTSVEGLDALPDGTLIAYVSAEVEEGEFDVPEIWVASINPTTGAVTFLVELTDLDDVDFYTDSLATDPISGVTYGFIDYDDGDPLVVRLDLAGGTYSGPVLLSGLIDELGDGYVVGADFDTAGTLWFYYVIFGDGNTNVLVSTSGDISAATVPETVSEVTQLAALQNLAYDPYVPQLAATGFPVLVVAAGGAALLGAGAIALFSRRRREV